MTSLAEAFAAHDRGWFLTPVNGKVPVLKSWPLLPLQNRSDVEMWIKNYGAVGVKTGHGFCILDVDPGADPKWLDPKTYPNTPIQLTPRGGLHVWLRTPDSLGNSAGKLAPHVDIRCKGGQAVLYDGWIVSPDTDIAEMPAEWLATLQAAVVAEKKSNAALRREVENVKTAVEGRRNQTLNTAAFNLGQLVAAGHLDALTARSCLEDAALSIGLQEPEITNTIDSGFRGAQGKPRTERLAEPVPSKTILIPGSHPMPNGTTKNVGTDKFVASILANIPDGILYRRDVVVGTIVDDGFVQLDADWMRSIIDEHLTLEMWKRVKDEPVKFFVPCSRDLASVVLSAASSSSRVRKITAICPHPVVTRDRRVLLAGYHDGVLVTYRGTLANPKPIWDFVSDFPFEDRVSMGNLLCAILTVLVAPTLNGNRPLFVFTAPCHRAGKSKLVDEVIGGLLFGHGIPMFTWPAKEDEVQKTVLAYAMSDEAAICIDNVPSKLDSAPLASLVTSQRVSGRILGLSKTATFTNVLTIFCTGTHVECSDELARRACVISLVPKSENPELRADFKYHDLRQAILDNRDSILAWCIEILMQPGKPATALGGFERWNDMVVGSVQAAGFPAMQDRAARVADMDDDQADLKEVLKRMREAFGDSWALASDILPFVEVCGAWKHSVLRSDKERSRCIALGSKLRKMAGREVGDLRLERTGTGSERWFRAQKRDVQTKGGMS